MQDPIDINFEANNTPDSLAEYYLPFLVSKKIDNTEIRTQLRNKHSFTPEKVRETMNLLAELAFDHHRKVPEPNVYLLYFNLVIGVLMIIGGLVLTLVFWKMGYILFATPIVFLSGFALLFKTNRQLNLLRQ